MSQQIKLRSSGLSWRTGNGCECCSVEVKCPGGSGKVMRQTLLPLESPRPRKTTVYFSLTIQVLRGSAGTQLIMVSWALG